MDSSDLERSAVASLDDDALIEIFSRLPIKALLRSKCVCKAWRGSIADPRHRRRLAQTLLGFFYGGGGGDINLLHTSFPFRKVELYGGIHDVRLLGTCNGLALLEFGDPATPCYVVCNPATAHWPPRPPTLRRPRPLLCAALPRRGGRRPCPATATVPISADGEFLVTVHVYSSSTGMWRHSETDWSLEEQQGDKEGWRHGDCIVRFFPSAFVNGSLFLLTRGSHIHEIDAEGKTRRTIPMPLLLWEAALKCADRNLLYLGQSQGRLHLIDCDSSEMSVWVLENHDPHNWVLKHSV
ncbi:hypothetical protein QOZ80_7AG0558810 [Eleusine coracana subsp. coracana]|nr:hypothetical protein QOZ80_7AG0558810 [Eleusine coracana subsp. coracana]